MQEDTPAASAAEPAPVVQPAAAPPETVAPAAEPRLPFVALKPIVSGPKVVEGGKIVSLTAGQATEFAKLIRPATAEDLAIFSQAPIEL